MRSLFFALCLAFVGQSVPVLAETCVVDGVAYSYHVIDGEAQITDVPSSTSGDLIVPARLDGFPVTSIGRSAFSDCKDITSLVFSDGLKAIEGGAFVRSSGLKSVVLPDGVTEIGDHAFQYCSGLSSVTLPDSVAAIGDGAFASCSGLQALKLPNALERLESDLLIYCSGLKSVQLPPRLREIGDGAFCDCDGLTSVTLPESVEGIGDYVFLRCSGLLSVIFMGPPPSTFGSGVFTYCKTVTGRYLDSHQGEWRAVLGRANSWNGIGMEQLSSGSGDDIQEDIEYGNLKGSAHSNPTSFSWAETLTETGPLTFTSPGRINGYTFTGWSPQVIDEDDSSSFATVTATWVPNRYTVAYAANGGVGEMDSSECLYGVEVEIATNAFVREGHDFIGWSTDCLVEACEYKGGEVVSNLTPSADDVVTLYAVWRRRPGYVEPVVKYTLAFDANGGDGTMESVECVRNQAVALPTNEFVRVGYDFRGWRIEGDAAIWEAGSVVSNLTLQSDGVVTLHAAWKSLGVKIYDLRVAPDSPWRLAIDFSICGAIADDALRPIEVSASSGSRTYVAAALEGETDCVDGVHRIYWNLAQDGISIDLEDSVVSVVYKYVPTEGAPYCVVDLSEGCDDAASYSVSYMDEPPSGGFNSEAYKTAKVVMKRVEAGSFVMGEDQGNEAHSVTLTRPFYMGVFELTQSQWELVMGSNPSYDPTDGAMKPVDAISYEMIRGAVDGAKWPTTNAVDADSFLGRLRQRTNDGAFDLPTEAQWEYACRAGTTTAYSYGDVANDDYMWYDENTAITRKYDTHQTYEVGSKLANPWGFYDMHGSVWEICVDYWNGTLWNGRMPYGIDPKGATSASYRVLRGGSVEYGADHCTSSYRTIDYPSFRHIDKGFRLSKSLADDVDAHVKVGDVTATARVANSANPTWWCRLASEAEASGLSDAATYNGILSSDDGPVGSIRVRASMPRLNLRTRRWISTLTISILVAGEKRVPLRGTLDAEDGRITLTAKDGRVLALSLGANGLRGSFGDYAIDGARDVFASRTATDKSRASAALANWREPLGVVSEIGMFSVMLSANGRARVSGTLADGARFSMTVQAILGVNGLCVPVVVSRRTMNLAFWIWLKGDGESACATGLGENPVLGLPSALTDAAAFHINADDLCELLGDRTFAAHLPDDVPVAQNGTKWIVAGGAKAGKVTLGKDGKVDAAKAGANPSALKLAYRAKDGSFTGSFKAYVLNRGKPKAVTANVRGVVVDGVGYGMATVKRLGSVPVTVE